MSVVPQLSPNRSSLVLSKNRSSLGSVSKKFKAYLCTRATGGPIQLIDTSLWTLVNSVAMPSLPSGYTVNGLAFDGVNVWFVGYKSGSVNKFFKINATTGALLTTYNVPAGVDWNATGAAPAYNFCCGLDNNLPATKGMYVGNFKTLAGTHYGWTINNSDATWYSTTSIGTGLSSYGVTLINGFNGEVFYVTVQTPGTLVLANAATGATNRTFSPGYNIIGVTGDSTYLYMTDGSNLYRYNYADFSLSATAPFIPYPFNGWGQIGGGFTTLG